MRPGGPPLMLGSVSPRMMRIGLPHVDAWNVWWSDYGNDVEGFAAVRTRVEIVDPTPCGRAWPTVIGTPFRQGDRAMRRCAVSAS